MQFFRKACFFMEIVLATRNKKKAEEMGRILSGMDVMVLTLDDFTGCAEVIEDRDTFEGNAIKKAVSAAECTNRIAVADDSGLEVLALNGAPGVLSARYAGNDADDAANIKKLLKEMEVVSTEKRVARFVCCIAIAFPVSLPIPALTVSKGEGSDANVVTFFGFVEGRIGKEEAGKMGFGYDPVFYPSGYERSFAEMTPDEKDAVSHRGKALKKFKDYVGKYFSETVARSQHSAQ